VLIQDSKGIGELTSTFSSRCWYQQRIPAGVDASKLNRDLTSPFSETQSLHNSLERMPATFSKSLRIMPEMNNELS
jgi:hypothetical protein